MAGHSKWAQIKRKKAVTDARRGKLWTKLLREITVAARLGGADPEADPRLRAAVQDAKANNVPNQNIERAILKGTGDLEGGNLEEMTYEGYAPGGVAVLIEVLTDNKNRTVSEIRHIFDRYGGNLGESGCVAWLFDQRGYLTVDAQGVDEEQLMEAAVEAGADDFSADGDVFEIYSAPADYAEVRRRLEQRGVRIASGELARLPKNTVEVGREQVDTLLPLLEQLEDHDDVQHVWSNFEVDEAVMAGR